MATGEALKQGKSMRFSHIREAAGEAAKEAAKEDDKKCYKTYPFEGMKAETNQKEISFIEYAKKRGPLTAEIFHKWSVHR